MILLTYLVNLVNLVYRYSSMLELFATLFYQLAVVANVLLDGKCDTAKVGQVYDFEEPVTWKDFRVTTLGSGTLWIFIV